MIGWLRRFAATIESLGHPARGIVGWFDKADNVSGVSVDERTALNYSAVWCAVRVISETIATLPCILYRRTENDERERADDDDRYWLVKDQPHPAIGSIAYFESQTANMLLSGNCYSRITLAGNGRVVSLAPRKPNEMKVRVNGDTVLYDEHDGDRSIPADEVLHIHGLGGDGISGWSVIRYANQSIGGAMAADNHSAGFLGNGAMPGGVLTIPERLKKEAREEYRREWEQIHGGSGHVGKIAILHGGIDFKPMQMTAEDSQLLETRQFNITEIARWFRLPPHLLGYLQDSSVRANLEQQGIEFVVYSLAPWLARWESQLNAKLLSTGERRTMYWEFLRDALLQGDIQSRYAAYAVGRQWGWLSVNDVRRKENMRSVDNGDDYLQPVNMTPLGTSTQATDSKQSNVQSEMLEKITGTIQDAKALCAALQRGNSAVADWYEALAERETTSQKTLSDIRAAVDKHTDDRITHVINKVFCDAMAVCAKIERAQLAKAACPAQEDEIDAIYKSHATCMQRRLEGVCHAAAAQFKCDAVALVEDIVTQYCDTARARALSASDLPSIVDVEACSQLDIRGYVEDVT